MAGSGAVLDDDRYAMQRRQRDAFRVCLVGSRRGLQGAIAIDCDERTKVLTRVDLLQHGRREIAAADPAFAYRARGFRRGQIRVVGSLSAQL
jgi:hypothetical protein